jgi:hypothetical protein
MNVQTKQILKDVAIGAVQGVFSFGVGCLAGKIAKGPILMTGALYGIAAVANYALNKLAQFLANKQKWNISTYQFSLALVGAALATAMSVTAFALGIFGPVGLGVTLGLGLLIPAYHIGVGLYAKFNKKDMPYPDAVELTKKKLADDATDKEKAKLAGKKFFYGLVTG